MSELTGVMVPLITPFDQEGKIDLATFRAHIGFLLDAGVDGLFVLGTTSETPLLGREEQETLVQATVEAAGGKLPVFAGVGAPSSEETLRRCRFAARAGADYAVVITPFYFKLDQAALLTHYRRVAQESPLPVAIYHYPAVTGNVLKPRTVGQIAEHENVIALKDSSGDVKAFAQFLQAVRGQGVACFGGDDALVLSTLALGGAGVVSGLANAFPRLFGELLKKIRQGHWEQARALQARVLAVQMAIARPSFIAGIKACLELQGRLPHRAVRAPLSPTSDEECQALESFLEEEGLV